MAVGLVHDERRVGDRVRAAKPRALHHRRIGEHERRHALEQRRRARQDARVMPPLGLEDRVDAVKGGRALRLPDCGDGLERNAELDGRAHADAAERAARVVRLGCKLAAARRRVGREGIIVRRAAHVRASEAGANLKALGRWEGEHGVRELGLEAVKDGLAEGGRHAGAHGRQRSADRVLGRLDMPDECGHPACGRRVRAAQ
mmetsp:Transcript_19964/g.62085  ORF Transcript_19964/g.62085 Transcript_19964/m.62085 type:complete len:202 (-) Transcript_19964:817-1422(-)